MKKKMYNQPESKVVEMKPYGALLEGSMVFSDTDELIEGE